MGNRPSRTARSHPRTARLVTSADIVGLELPALQKYFDANVAETAGKFEATQLTGGKSNLTYRLDDGTNRWVLRRPPLGVLTPTAHDVAREYRVIRALAGSAVPVAEPVICCEDASVIGVPFAVVCFVDGTTLQDGDQASQLSSEEARLRSTALVDSLAALHSVDYAAVGLENFGRPAGYLGRQVVTWRRQWDRVTTRHFTDLDRLYNRLEQAVPVESAHAIVHGDYRLDNVIFDADSPGRIAAIIDWEMATLGDPLADLALLQVYWDPATAPVLGVRHAPSANDGFLSADEMAQRYQELTQRAVDDLSFYRALGYFKLAVIAEGIHQRFLSGHTVGSGFDTVGSAVGVLLDRGLNA